MKRAHISLKTKLASALLKLGHVPSCDAKAMTADQIISLYVWDHYPIRHADGGSSEPWNLEPRLIAAHREKTAKVDVPEMAKSKRLVRKQAVHQARMEASTDSFADLDRAMAQFDRGAIKFLSRKREIPSRPFPNKKRKFANRNGN